MTISQSDDHQMEKLRTLLTEYSSLRSETVARTGYSLQVFSIAVTAFTVLVSWRPQSLNLYDLIAAAVALALILLVIFAAAWNWRDIKKVARRIREIESLVNGYFGQTVLVWETYWGSARTGIWGRAEPIPYPVDEATKLSLRRPAN
jgi:hypothetical protein